MDSATPWPVIKEHFNDALALTGDDRRRLLDTLDDATRAEVQALLGAAEGTDAFIDRPLDSALLPTGVDRAVVSRDEAPPQDAVLGPGPLTGVTLGPYHVGPRIGRGGMGDVYRARRADGLFERAVALKVVREGADSDAVLARFAAERRILGSLEHPGIARLHSAGAEETGPAAGRPWLALELVDGVPITEAARGLAIEDRVALLAEVARAVHHAHRRLVVHRDLKPSNVLVTTDDGTRGIKLLDFGIAKLLGPEADADLTALHLRTPMTRAYAAPEQVRGDTITTATDVYGLGLLAFETLTGRRPFATDGTVRQLEADILETEPPQPSAVSDEGAGGADARVLQGDLDVICRTALSKAPEDRYTSAEALASDLWRWLRHEPIEARAPSAGYRLRRFVQRNRTGVLAATLVGLVLSAGAVLYTVGLATERDRAEAALEEAETTATFLEDVLAAADPFATVRLDTLRAADLLGAALQTVDREFADQPLRRGHLYTVIGRTYGRLGRDAEADSVLRLAQPLVASDPEYANPARAALASVLVRGDSAAIREAVRLAKGVVDDRAERYGADGVEVAESLKDLSFAQWRSGDDSLAISNGRRAVVGFRAARPIDSLGLAQATLSLADILDNNEPMEAAPLYRETVALRRGLYGSDHPALAVALNSYAGHLRNNGQDEEAMLLAREALGISRSVLGPDHPNTVSESVLVASLLRKAGQYDEAIALIEDALERTLRVRGPRFSSLPYIYDSYARALIEAERFEEADAALATGLRTVRDIAGAESVSGANMVSKRGSVALAQGDPTTAVRYASQALDEFEAVFETPDNAFSAPVYVTLGKALDALGRTRESEQAYQTSLRAFEAVYGPDHPHTERARERLRERDT